MRACGGAVTLKAMLRRLTGPLAAGLLSASAFAAAPPARITLEPPPGWKDVTAQKPGQDLVLALKGPELSSFVLTRVEPMSLDNRAVTRAYLADLIADLNRRTGLGFSPAGNLSRASYDNGLTAHFLRAHHKGRPRLILAVMEFGGNAMVGILMSSVPDTILPSILGGLRASGEAPEDPSGVGRVVSLDGQLSLGLAEGLSPRPVTEREKRMGFVAALRGLDSELMIMKLVELGTPIKDQPGIVKDTVLAVEGVERASLSSIQLFETPAGPDLVYAWARLNDSAGPGQFAAGYMPWGYWGYSILAKGPRAADLTREAFADLALGPSAVPKLVAETPKVPVPAELRLKRGSGWIYLALGAAVLLAAAFLRRRRRNGAEAAL